MKEVHRKLLFEMMTNSRRSDRELAKALKVSQPTVTRTRNWLEANGYVMEYTLIPNFDRIGFELAAFTFIKLRVGVSKKRDEEIRKEVVAFLDGHPNVIMACRGEGMGCDEIVMSFHESFFEFSRFIRELKMNVVEADVVGSFLASLDEANHLRCLTLRTLKDYGFKNGKDDAESHIENLNFKMINEKQG